MRLLTLRAICRVISLVLALGIIPLPAHAAAACGGDFGAWLQGLKQDAAAAGVSQRTIQAALANVTYDPTIIARDHAQGVFKQSFEQFSGRMVPPRLARGRNMLIQYGSIFNKIEDQFGVPGPVIVAIWGLETDFGTNPGKFPTIRSLASLAYDCRRPDFFTDQLYAALKLVDRGALSGSTRGSMHGEVGQTQFMPKNILAYGTGNLDVAANALSSTANFLKAHGWRAGAGYQPGEANFAAIEAWNAAQVYQKAIAIMGRQIDGGG